MDILLTDTNKESGEVMNVAMKNPKTGQIKEVKVGFSWTLFFFSGFFGIPLFLRKLYLFGFILLGSSFVNVTNSIGGSLEEALIWNLISLIVIVYVAIKGNELTAKNYLKSGWEFLEPDSELTKMVKVRWKIND